MSTNTSTLVDHANTMLVNLGFPTLPKEKKEKKRRSYPWSKVDHDDRSITFTGREGATWEEMDEWLEDNYGKNGKDRHWKWRGFGECGKADFKVVLLRQACAEWICDCEMCDRCGVTSCDLSAHEDGDRCCYECREQAEEDGEWESAEEDGEWESAEEDGERESAEEDE
jgi:hypothetical protein